MDTFSAVADPTRRAILDLLVEHERSVADLVDAFPAISQPAVSIDLRVLRDAGLVSVQDRAQQRIYSIQPKALAELEAWIAKYKILLAESLDALEKYLSMKEKKRS